jgi:hypothetical protein
MHGSCKFNKCYQIHENKVSWVQHKSKSLMTTTTINTNVVTECTPFAIVLLTVLYCIVSDEIKCAVVRLSCEHNKIWEWRECIRKAGHKKWFEKRSFWHAWDLNSWCGCDRSFLYLLIPIQAITTDEGQTEACPAQLDLQCLDHHRDSRARQDKDLFPTGVLRLGCCRTPSGISISHTPSVHWWKQSMSPPFTLMRRH